MTRFIPLTIAMLLVASAVAIAGDAANPFDTAMQHYRAREFDKALTSFEAALADQPDSADIHAWMAATLERLDRRADAQEHAQKAVELDPRNSFGYTMLGRILNPRYSQYENADADASWLYFRKAVEADPDNGDAWTLLWIDAMARGDHDMESKALRNVARSGFFAKPIMSYAQWTLEQLPENAVLITNGDLDTFPTVALQAASDVRPDVAVVNLSLLNMPWYTELVCERAGLPLPAEDVSAMKPKTNEDGTYRYVGHQTVESWLEKARSGELNRPITVAVTLPLSYAFPSLEGDLTFHGAYWLYEPDAGESIDVPDVEQAIAAADALDFSGATMNPADPSPLRDGAGLLTNVTAAALQLSRMHLDAGHPDRALEMIAWAERFEGKTNAAHNTALEQYRKAAQEALESSDD